MRETEASDADALLRARAAVFAASEARSPRATRTSDGPEALRWRYRENPAGARSLVATTPDGALLAHLGGVPARVRLESGAATWTRVVDAFAVPGARTGLGKQSAFVRTARAFDERWFGPGEDRDQVLHGLPTRPAYRVAKELLGFEVVRNLNRLAAPPERVRPRAAGGVEVREEPEFPDAVDELFERAARPFGAAIVRDRAFLAWRFGQAADAAEGMRSRVALARAADGTLAGYAVLRRGAFDGRPCALLWDWLVDPDRPGAGSALRAWAAERARADGEREVAALLPEFCEDSLDFQREGFRLLPTSFFQMAKSALRPQDSRWLYERWFTTLADH